jgi:tellurite resistance protein
MADPFIVSCIADAELAADQLRLRDEEILQALATAGALVALSDGQVKAVERDELLDFVDRQGIVPTKSRRDVAQAFDGCVLELEERHAASVIMESFRPLAGKSVGSIVVRAAETVAAADRELHPAELQAMKLIRVLLKP